MEEHGVTAMSRRSMTSAARSEATFPIRVNVVVPRDGLGKLIEEIGSWLNREIGPGRYGQAPAPMLGGNATGFHFLSLEEATRFLAAFPELEMAVGALDVFKS